MKLLHLGDLHLGRSLGDFDLLGEQRYILDEVLRLAYERQGIFTTGLCPARGRCGCWIIF